MQEKTLTGGRSYYLDIARAIAIISISLNHAVNRTYDNYFGQMEEFLEFSYLSSLLKSVATVFSHLGVPLFLMISGALLPALNSLLVLRDLLDILSLCLYRVLYQPRRTAKASDRGSGRAYGAAVCADLWLSALCLF